MADSDRRTVARQFDAAPTRYIGPVGLETPPAGSSVTAMTIDDISGVSTLTEWPLSDLSLSELGPRDTANSPGAESAALASLWGRSYDVAPDGRRFLLALSNAPPTNLAPTQMISCRTGLRNPRADE